MLFQTISCFTLAQNGRYVYGKNYEGYSFPKDYEIWGFQPSSGRYTLCDEEIKEAEMVLKKNIKKYNQRILFYNKITRVRYRLKKYYRQYYGDINDKGERIVVIFLWLKSHYSIKELRDEIRGGLGGSLIEGPFEVNLETKELTCAYDLSKVV